MLLGGCAIPSAYNHPSETPCRDWLYKVRLAWQTPYSSDWPDPGARPLVCDHLEDFAWLMDVRRQWNDPKEQEEAVNTVIRESAWQTFHQVARSWSRYSPYKGPDQDEVIGAAVSLLNKKHWSTDQAADATGLLRFLKAYPRYSGALLARLLVDYPQTRAVRKWENKNRKEAGIRIANMTRGQGQTRLANLAEARRVKSMKQTLKMLDLGAKSETRRFWLGRIAFLERHYDKAYRRFHYRTKGSRERRRKLWEARTLARLDKLQRADKLLTTLNGKWDRWRCDAWYRRALIAGYQKKTLQRRDLLASASRYCDRFPSLSASLAWEQFRAELFARDNSAASQILNSKAAVLERYKYLQATEIQFWRCWLVSRSDGCAAMSQQDPFLPYRLALTNPPPPSIRLATPGHDASSLRVWEARLLVDLRLSGWNDLYLRLLRERHRNNDDPAIESLIALAEANLKGPFASIAVVKKSLPRASTFTWSHFLTLYPKHWQQRVLAASDNDIGQAILSFAIMREESRFRADARSWVGALGLMQLMPDTANRVAGYKVAPSALTDPDTNIRLGTLLLQNLVKYYDGDLVWAIAAYNAGRLAVDTWRKRFSQVPPVVALELIPYPQTRKYVKKVARSYLAYRWQTGLGPWRRPACCASRSVAGLGSATRAADNVATIVHHPLPLLLPPG